MPASLNARVTARNTPGFETAPLYCAAALMCGLRRGKQPSRKRGVHQCHHGAVALHRVVGAGAQVVQQERGDDCRRRVLRRDAQARQQAEAGQGDARGAAVARNRRASARRALVRACSARTGQT